MSSSRMAWLALIAFAAAYLIAVGSASGGARLDATEGRALKAATRFRAHGDVDLAIEALETAHGEGCDGDSLLGSLGIGYLDLGDHAKAQPYLEQSLASLREREDRPWHIGEFQKNIARGLFSCHLAQGAPDEAEAVALEEGGYAPPYVQMALAWGYPEMADRLIDNRLAGDILEVRSSERVSLSISAVSASVARGDIPQALERWSTLTEGIGRQRSSPLEIVVKQAEELRHKLTEPQEEGAVGDAKLDLGQTYLRLNLASMALEQITPPNEPADPAHLIEALRMQVEILEGLGLDEEALRARRRLIRLAPEDTEARWGLAQDLRFSGSFEESEAGLRWVLEREPGRGRAWLLLGDVCRRLDRPGDACDAYSEGVRAISDGRLTTTEGVEAGDSPLLSSLLLACQDLAEMAQLAHRPDDELLAWNTILDMAYRPGREPTDPPQDWLAEMARYRVYLITGEAPPPLPGAEDSLGGAMFRLQ